MDDVFDTLNKGKKDGKNLKSWAVKLPEETIETLEKLYGQSGLRYKNQFMESILQTYEFYTTKEENSIIHPELIKESQGEIAELNRIITQIQSIYLSQLEKQSDLRNRYEGLQRENLALKETFSNSVINEYCLVKSRKMIKNRLLTGTPNSGKTHAIKQEIIKARKEDRDVIILDMVGEYKKLTQLFNGVTIDMEKNRLNVLEFYGSKEDGLLTDKGKTIYNFIQLLLGDISPVERKVILESIELTYTSYGFSQKENKNTNTFPTLATLIRAIQMHSEVGSTIASRLDLYTEEELRVISELRDVKLPTENILAFDLHLVNDKLKPAVLYITLEYIKMMVQHDLLDDDTLVVIDGTTFFNESKELVEQLTNLLKNSSDKRVEYIITSQSIADFHANQHGVCPYLDTVVYFKQTEQDINAINHNLLLGDTRISEFLGNAHRGECVIKTENEDCYYMRFPAGDGI